MSAKIKNEHLCGNWLRNQGGCSIINNIYNPHLKWGANFEKDYTVQKVMVHAYKNV